MAKRNVMFRATLAAAVLVMALVAPAQAGGPQMAGAKTDRFLLIMPHTPEQCLAALDGMESTSPALLAKTDWGCMAGDHTGYVVVQAANEEAARNMIPANERAQAKVVKLNKFTADQIRSFHKKM